MKIGVLGGSFDPPHIGHLMVVQQILEIRRDIDKILLVPAYQHQWKPYFATPRQRLSMLKPFTTSQIEISDIEIERKGISYTIDTIKTLQDQAGAAIYWIVGSDILSEFNRWEKKEELTKLATFLVFPRDPYHLPKQVPQHFEVITNNNLITTNISSTIIRQRVKEGKSITHLVDPDVEKYILKRKLYE